ncbi:unnamed protein product [Schistosoma mattheei]|uniref:Uncharacterized protein n=1 Tax=Schistosoma mattheei TaxID=31246 RepID=A0A183PI82_9TREM|nr:unnamed protein product [Schistosoma mattheei]
MNLRRESLSIWDSSAGCTCILEFMFTMGLHTNRTKRQFLIHLATESR